jgi:histidinol-phosphate/aromatic aminotransferase/cobyric acid decarboxylase-like protein
LEATARAWNADPEHTGVAVERVALGSGSAELLWLIAWLSSNRATGSRLLGPTFGEYARAARVVGADVHESTSMEDLSAAPLVFVCNPNNPTRRS